MPRCELDTLFGPCFNKIYNRFCPCKVNTPVEKRPPGKFSRPGKPCPGFHYQFEDLPVNYGSTVAIDFYHVFSRVGSRSFHKGQENLVENSLGFRVYYGAIIKVVRDKVFKGRGVSEQFPCDGKGIGTTDLYDPDSTFAHWGCKSTYCIVQR